MGKYLVLWEVDPTKVPIDPKERGAAWGMLIRIFEIYEGIKEFRKIPLPTTLWNAKIVMVDNEPHQNGRGTLCLT